MRTSAWLIAFAAALPSCLPNDTRPAPGSVLVTLESDGVAANGIAASETVDGWSIDFDRVLVTLGNVSLDGDNCDTYSDATYNRIFDAKTAGPQKVSISYAIGPCDLGFRSGSPNFDSLLMAGVSDADKAFMRTPATDDYARQSGMSAYVRGHATQGDVRKSFEWAFRLRARYLRCGRTAEAGGHSIELTSKGARTVTLGIGPGVLFADDLDPARAHTRFQVFADADSVSGNNDGAVTLAELGRVPASLAGFAVAGEPDGGDVPRLDAGFVQSARRDAAGGEPSLEDYVYLVLFPAMIRYPDGDCTLSLTERGLGS